jgi:hypothetical protein
VHNRAVWAAYGMAALIAACIMLGYAEGVRGAEEPPRTPHGVPMSGVATWYGARCPKGVSYLGRTDTCTPYKSVEQGGRGGELVLYAAVGTFTYYAKPYGVRVCLRDGTKCVIAVVRDYCHGAWRALRRPWDSTSRVIDLSPTLFQKLAPLSRGVIYVRVEELGGGHRGR